MGDAHAQAASSGHTPFGSKRTAGAALDRLFDHFGAAEALVVSYGSNADARRRRSSKRCSRATGARSSAIEIAHRYAFGTHATAERRVATEYVFVGR